MSCLITKGSTDVTRYVLIADSTDGSPETGVTITGLDLQYTRAGAAPAAKVDATALAATNSAHSDNKAIEIDATSSPGLYRVDWPDAAFASGVDSVILVVSGTGFQPAIEEITLTDVDVYDAMRGGMTALPNANADAAGGLPISDAGGLDLDSKLAATNEVTAARMAVLTDWINGGRLDLLLDAITPAGPTKAEMDAAHALLATPAQVNTEVSDVLKTDTIAEMAQQAPPATPTFEEAVMYLYMALRNKVVVDSTVPDKEYHNDAGAVIWRKAWSDAASVYTENEGSAGP